MGRKLINIESLPKPYLSLLNIKPSIQGWVRHLECFCFMNSDVVDRKSLVLLDKLGGMDDMLSKHVRLHCAPSFSGHLHYHWHSSGMQRKICHTST